MKIQLPLTKPSFSQSATALLLAFSLLIANPQPSLGVTPDTSADGQTQLTQQASASSTAIAASHVSAAPVASHPRKVVVFYSSIGSGHLSAAQAIKQEILRQEPETVVELKNIRDFMPKWAEKLDEKLFWFVVKNKPELFDKMYKSFQDRGIRANPLSRLPNDYPKEQVLNYLKDTKPDSIIATHYGSAQVLGALREQGQLQSVPIAWLHTDYVTGYFPRISKTLDKTFLPHPALESEWVAQGVDPARIVTTGIPLSSHINKPTNAEEFLRSQGLNPSTPTVTLISGKEGIGDFPAIVKSIAESGKEPIQIVAICGNNESHVKALTKLQSQLGSHVSLKILGYSPSNVVLDYFKSSQVVITKSGGLTPGEVFSTLRPTVLLDVFGGHERENAVLFEQLGLAEVNRDPKTIGSQVLTLLHDEKKRESMLRAQQEFREVFNIDETASFALDRNLTPQKVPADFGVEGGTPARNTAEALSRLEKDSPADVEILLSYGASKTGKYPDFSENPFGHLALRVGDTVYTANHLARPGVEDRLLHDTSLEEYLYGTKRTYANQEHTSSFGMAYGRDNLGLRIRGISPEALAAMKAEAEKVQEEFRQGICSWDVKKNNCADFTSRILKAGGVDTKSMPGPKSGVTLPLNEFDRITRWAENSPNYTGELVMYARHPGSQNAFKVTDFPISYSQPLRSLKHILRRPSEDPLEKKVTKQVVGYPSDDRVYYENLNGQSVGAAQDAAETRMRFLAAREAELIRSESDLVDRYVTLKSSDKSPTQVLATLRNQVASARKASQPGAPLRLDTPEWKPVLASLTNADRAQLALHTDVDHQVKAEYDLILDRYLEVAKQGMDEMKGRLPKKAFARLESSFRKLENLRSTYASQLHLYGGPKDYLRTTSSLDFFQETQKFSKIIDQELNRAPADLAATLRGFSERLNGSLEGIHSATQLAPEATRLLGQVFRPQPLTEGKVPATVAIKNLMKKRAEALGIEIDVKGRENIPALNDPKTINIFASTHRNALNDALTMSSVIPDDGAIFAATHQFLPERVAPLLNNNPAIIPVGDIKAEPPIDRAMKLIEEGRRSFFIYPEGDVPGGLMELRSPREKFENGLIRRIRESGYAVNIIPITYSDNAAPMNQAATSPTRLSVHVDPPITDDMISVITRTQGDQALNRFLRSSWMDHLRTDDNFFAGMLRVRPAQQVLDQAIKPAGVGVDGKCLINQVRTRLLAPPQSP